MLVESFFPLYHNPMCDSDDEPLEFCHDSGYPDAEPPMFGGPVSKATMQEIADVANSLPPDFTRNRAQLGFGLWCIGKVFQNELAVIAARHGL